MSVGNEDLLTGAQEAPVAEPATVATTPGAGSAQGPGPGRRARALPYLLILPSIVAFVGLLGYPLYQVVRISFLKLDLAELIQRRTVFRGLANYRAIFADSFLLVDAGADGGVHRRVRGADDGAGDPGRAAARPARQAHAPAGVGQPGAGLGDAGADRHGGVAMAVRHSVRGGELAAHYAGLTAIPRELYDAIRVDGAGAWRTFRSLIFPTLRPLFMVTAFLSIIWDFKVFTQIWLVRHGGPDRQTVTLGIYAYLEGIRNMLRTQEDL